MPRLGVLAAKLDGGPILHVLRRGDGGCDGLPTALQSQTWLDGTDHEALPLVQRGKLPNCLGFRQRLERWNVLKIGGRQRGERGVQGRRREAHAEYPVTIFWRSSHHEQ